MTEDKALIPVQSREMTLAETMTLGETLAKSGFFSDTKSVAQAVVKILAGRELGFGPIASMTGIHVIKSQVAVGGNLMAARVKRDPRYDYKVVELTDERCEIAFFEQGKEMGRSIFTAQDAQRAEIGKLVAPGAKKDMMGRFPRNMLFNRAMSNGVRWYCPDAFGGNPTYTPEELGAEVDDDGNVIEGQFTNTPQPTQEPAKSNGGNGEAPHWIDAVDERGRPIRARFWAKMGEMTLTREQVHEALGVKSLRDFDGSMKDAMTKIEDWLKAQDTIDAAVEELYGEEPAGE